MSKEGINVVEIRQDGVAVESISTEESVYFCNPDDLDEVLIDRVATTAYSIVSLAFKPDNKWRLHDGNVAISVQIADVEFLQKVDESRISFAKGDILICEVRTVQRRSGPDLNQRACGANISRSTSKLCLKPLMIASICNWLNCLCAYSYAQHWYVSRSFLILFCYERASSYNKME